MTNTEVVCFTAQEMSDPRHARRARVVADAILDSTGGSVVSKGAVTVVPVEGGAVISRARPTTDGEVEEFVDIRVVEDEVYGVVHSKHRAVTGPDELSAKSMVRHLAGMALDLGIAVISPESHTMEPLR